MSPTLRWPRKIALAVAAGWLHVLARCLPVRRLGRSRVQRLTEQGEPLVYACLHGDGALLISCHLDESIAPLVSTSCDGDLAAQLFARLGWSCARGSSSRRGAWGLRSLLRLCRAGHKGVITVDGPRGPAGKVAPGVLALARLGGLWVVPVAAHCRSGLTLNSWDRAQLPLPWSTTLVLYGRPFRVSRSGPSDQVLAERLESQLLSLAICFILLNLSFLFIR